MKVVIGGSFSVYEEMKELARKLEEIGVGCVLPKHFKGYKSSNLIEQIKQDVKNGKTILTEEDYKRIGEVESWFFEQIKKAEYLVIHDKAVKNGKEIKGYVGMNTSTDIGCGIASGKEIILTYLPEDIGLRGLCSVGLLKVMSVDEVVKYLKEKMRK
jgi:hypothetical protein